MARRPPAPVTGATLVVLGVMVAGVLAVEAELVFGVVRAAVRGRLWSGPADLVGYAIVLGWTVLVVVVGVLMTRTVRRRGAGSGRRD